MMTPIPRNPYVVGGALTDPSGFGFYGRRDVIDFVRQHLNVVQRSPILLYGQRRMGKTSILRQLPNHLPDDLALVYFDLQGNENLPLDQFLYDLAVVIHDHRSIKDHLEDVNKEDATHETFASRFLPQVFKALDGDKHRLVLLFDEMDVVDQVQLEARPDSVVNKFRVYMRKLINEEQQVGYVFVLGRRPEELNESYNAQLFRGAVQKRIGYLRRSETEQLVTKPPKGYLHYPPETIQAIYALTKGHPYCTQLICSRLWYHCLEDNSRYPVTVSPDDVKETLPEALDVGRLGLNWIYDGLAEPPHKLFLSATAETVDAEGKVHLSKILDQLRQHRIGLAQMDIERVRRDLVNWDILELVERDTYRFRVEMVLEWILTERTLGQMLHESRFLSPRAYQAYELADGYRRDGQIQQAIERYREALRIYPQLIDAQIGLADSLRQMEDWSAAIEAYAQVAELDPSRVEGLQEVLLEYGGRLEEEGKLEQAIQHYERAAELIENPRVQDRLGRALQAYGRMLVREERFEDAASLFERLGYTRNLQDVLLEYGDSLEQAGEFEKAIRQYERATKLAENTRAQDRLERAGRRYGEMLVQERKFDEAVTTLERLGFTGQVKRVEEVRSDTWRRIKAQVDDLTQPTGQIPNWQEAYKIVREYQQLNPRDENSERLIKQIRQREKMWNNEQGDASMAAREFGKAAEFYLNAGNEKKLGVALARASKSDDQNQFDNAEQLYQELGNKEKVLTILLAQWHHQMTKTTWRNLRRAVLLFVIGIGSLLALLIPVPPEWALIARTGLLLTAIIFFYGFIYSLSQLLFSDLLMRQWLYFLLKRQLTPELPIDEIRRRIHNFGYVRPMVGSALGWGIIFGTIGWLVSADRLNTIGWLGFLAWFLIGIGVVAVSYQHNAPPKSDLVELSEQERLKRLSYLEPRYRTTLACLGYLVFMILGSSVMQVIFSDSPSLNSNKLVAEAIFGLVALTFSLFAIQNSWKSIRRVMKHQIRDETKEQ